MTYSVEFTPGAETDLSGLATQASQRVLNRLRWLADNFESIRPEPLTGPWRGMFKLRVGDHRVLYTYDRAGRKIVVRSVKHRREVYRTR